MAGVRKVLERLCFGRAAAGPVPPSTHVPEKTLAVLLEEPETIFRVYTPDGERPLVILTTPGKFAKFQQCRDAGEEPDVDGAFATFRTQRGLDNLIRSVETDLGGRDIAIAGRIDTIKRQFAAAIRKYENAQEEAPRYPVPGL